MLFMLAEGMESVPEFNQETKEIQNNTETSANADDRESSVESFHTNKSETSITTETELIDVDDIELSDEESWLYKSPKKIPSETCVNKCIQKNVEDMDKEELKSTRTALLSKLDNLKLLKSSSEQTEAKNPLTTSTFSSADKSCRVSVSTLEKSPAVTAENVTSSNKPRTKYDIECQDRKNSHVLDVVDVQKIARLQEESLKQSTYKFLNQTGKRTPSSGDLSPVSPAQGTNLNKPASVEALNTFTEKTNLSNVYSMIPLEGMKKQSMFCSSSSINCNKECHRGSLPNIHKGYNSLKGRKSKRTSEPKVSCPLPIYPTHPKVNVNGSNPQACDFQNKLLPPSYDQRETRTLPSSYRIHSNRNSSSRRDLGSMSPSPRRESMPYLGNNVSSEPNQRENRRKLSSPVSTNYPRCSLSSLTVNPTKAFNIQSQNLRSPSNMEYHRAASHSPSRRHPLSVVQHQSPKKRNNLASLKNGEIGTLPSKIPNPALKSGIPVPSTCASRANDDGTWNQDCY